MVYRKARSQAEVDFLPPFGQPEVHVTGAVATGIIAFLTGLALLIQFGE